MSTLDPVVTPVAEAIKAVAETSGKVIDALSDLGRVVKGPVEDLVGIVSDRVKFARWKGRQRLLADAEEVMRQKNLPAPTRELPLNFAVPLLTSGILEEDDDLRKVWARLLVNAGDASTPMELRTAYVEILRGMSSFDVSNLAALAELTASVSYKGYADFQLPTSILSERGLLLLVRAQGRHLWAVASWC